MRLKKFDSNIGAEQTTSSSSSALKFQSKESTTNATKENPKTVNLETLIDTMMAQHTGAAPSVLSTPEKTMEKKEERMLSQEQQPLQKVPDDILQAPDRPARLNRTRRLSSTTQLSQTPPWELNIQDFELHSKLGVGTYGETYLALWKEPGKSHKVTVKKLFDNNFTAEDLESFCNETKSLVRLKHPHLATVFGSGVKDGKYVVSQYIDGCSLFGFLRNPITSVTPSFILSVARQVASAVLYLHEQGVIHGQLKSKNVLLDRDNVAFVKDFGYLDLKDQIDRAAFSPNYLAPELISGATYNEKVDSYSFGVLLWELFTRKTPFASHSPHEIIQEVTSGHLKLDIPTGCPPVFERLMTSCWSTDPAQRPSFEKIVAVLNAREEEIFVYDQKKPAAAIPISSQPQTKVSLEVPKVAKVKRLTGLKQMSQISTSVQTKEIDLTTKAKLSQVVAKITELLKSANPSQQLKAVNAIQTLVTDGDRLDYLAGNVEFVKSFLGILDNPVLLIDPNYRELLETAVKIMTETAAKHRKFFEVLQQHGIIPTLVTVLTSCDNDSLRILTCKGLAVYAEDPNTREILRLAGGILPLLNLLRSHNEFVQLQATWVLSSVLEEPLSQIVFLNNGGLEIVNDLLRVPHPGLQIRLLELLIKFIGNEKAAQKLDQMNIKAKYMSMLTAASPLLRNTAIKAISKFASHGMITDENEAVKVLKVLMDTLNMMTFSVDTQLLIQSAIALYHFTTKKEYCELLRDMGLLSILVKAILAPDVILQKHLLRIFYNMLVDPKSKEAATALGGCASCIKLVVNEHPEIRQLTIAVLNSLVTDNPKGVKAVSGVEGVPSILSVFYSTEDETEKLSLAKILLSLSVDQELKSEIRESGGIAAIVETLNTTRNEGLLLTLACTLCNLSENQINRRILLEEKGVPVLLKILTTHKDLKLVTVVIDTFTLLARDADLLETLRIDGLVDGLAYVLGNFTDDGLLVSSLRVLLLMTQSESAKVSIRNEAGKQLQNLATCSSQNVQIAAKKILSLL
jgi:serine/threonine protein kinase